ncbi:MAG TPA: hypothetical protein VMT76_10140 [Puia sp.]|nr:hypothetical protein [Puia sp.]
MKKGILIFALMLTGFSYSFARTTDGITKKAVESFNKEFSSARNTTWENKGSYMIVTFSMNSQIMFAYYGNNGELIGVARNILSDKLPISQLISLKKNYSDYWISNLFEVSMDNDTTYYVTLENADQKLVLKSSDYTGWEVYSKEEKQ